MVWVSFFLDTIKSLSSFNFIILGTSTQPSANTHAEPPSGDEQSAGEPEAPTVSIKDKTKDLDTFFHLAEKVGGKPTPETSLYDLQVSRKFAALITFLQY